MSTGWRCRSTRARGSRWAWSSACWSTFSRATSRPMRGASSIAEARTACLLAGRSLPAALRALLLRPSLGAHARRESRTLLQQALLA
eukprot:10667765-Alexandrium_andersonii.AAC.1